VIISADSHSPDVGRDRPTVNDLRSVDKMELSSEQTSSSTYGGTGNQLGERVSDACAPSTICCTKYTSLRFPPTSEMRGFAAKCSLSSIRVRHSTKQARIYCVRVTSNSQRELRRDSFVTSGRAVYGIRKCFNWYQAIGLLLYGSSKARSKQTDA